MPKVSGEVLRQILEFVNDSSRREVVEFIQTAAGGNPYDQTMDGESEVGGVEWGLQTNCHEIATKKGAIKAIKKLYEDEMITLDDFE